MGNRLTKQDSGAGTQTNTFDAANRPTSVNGAAYTNDLNGNTLTGGGRTNTWDSQNRLTQCTFNNQTSSYVYGADGLRHRSVTGTTANPITTDYALDGQNVVQELRTLSGVPTPIATYLTGPSGPMYKRTDGDGTIRWYVYDGLGSVVGEVDPNGVMTARRGFDVYGATRSSSGVATSKHGFVGGLGHTSEDDSGLIYMRARWYDAGVGRFTSQDLAKNGKNWFSYAGDNPINGFDYRGESTGNVNEPAEAAEAEQEAEGEGGDAAFEVLKSARNTIADITDAKWYDSKGLVRAIQKIVGGSKDQASAIIHAAKEYGLGGADNIGLDSAGGLWTKTGEFLGFVDDFL